MTNSNVRITGAELKLDFQRGGGPIHLNNVQCIGNESNLYGCQHHIYITTVSCIHVVGVSCSFDVPCKSGYNFDIEMHANVSECSCTVKSPNKYIL